MGYLAKVVSFARTVIAGEQTPEVRFDRDGDDTGSAHHFGAPGDDAPPLAGDVVYVGDDAGRGVVEALGYQDPMVAGTAEVGERRIYSRAAPGVVIAEVWLKRDGAIIAKTPAGELALAADGALVAKTPAGELSLGVDGSARIGNAVGELAVDAAGNVTWKTALGTNGAATHMHPTPFGPSGPPLPGT